MTDNTTSLGMFQERLMLYPSFPLAQVTLIRSPADLLEATGGRRGYLATSSLLRYSLFVSYSSSACMPYRFYQSHSPFPRPPPAPRGGGRGGGVRPMPVAFCAMSDTCMTLSRNCTLCTTCIEHGSRSCSVCPTLMTSALLCTACHL